MIYQISYMSDNYQVKGYLALPYGVIASTEQLTDWLNSFYKTSTLEVLPIACPLHPATKPIVEGQYPVFVYCRGGIGRVGSVRMDWLERFAQHGHIVFAPCYRGAEGGEGRDEFGGGDVEDVLSGIRWLNQLPFVDEQRISIMGFSRGSVNAAQAAVRSTEPPLSRLILWGGVSDLARTYEERIDLRRMLKRVIGGSTGKYPERYEARSPVALAEQIHCPVLVIHGRQDLQVDYSHAENMIQRLQELDKEYDVQIYEDYGHHMPEDVHKQAITAMFDWIQQK
ncbi:alpha/beta hydrolase family protein [Paenibacillus dauci]|uniref:alpha/beta hydrolase family protein n=1 Tax=Paenibacillus dauci TaxID=1567106 RepID=UPI0006198A24|nr:prolyl oligopeptidase family serine peptidase [Paenibacillus dauci]